MQKITIADISIKTGTNDKGGWTNTTLIDESGGRFSSFDTKLSHLTKGAVIEAEITVKGKFNNIGEWKLISEGAPAAASTTTAPQMSKEDWAKKDAIERISFEAQTAVKAVMALAEKGFNDEGTKKVVAKALKWCENRIDRTSAPGFSQEAKAKASDAVKPVPKATHDQIEKLEQLKKDHNIDLKELVAKKGWAAGSLSQLTTAQAKVLIDENDNLPF